MAIMIDMKMPKNCAECRFRSDGWCYAIPEYEKQPTETKNDRRPYWCPIKETPKHAGDAFGTAAYAMRRLENAIRGEKDA